MLGSQQLGPFRTSWLPDLLLLLLLVHGGGGGRGPGLGLFMGSQLCAELAELLCAQADAHLAHQLPVKHHVEVGHLECGKGKAVQSVTEWS